MTLPDYDHPKERGQAIQQANKAERMATQSNDKPEGYVFGRPTLYTQQLADEICERVANGESIRGICKADTAPAMSSIFKWLNEHKDFSEQYARAREEQAETFADEIVGIADEECTMVRADKHHGAKSDDEDGNVEVVFDATAVARNRLRVDARKWVAAKLKPKKYGEKVEVTQKGTLNLRDITSLTDVELEHIAATSSDRTSSEA